MCRATPCLGHDRANGELEKGRSAALDQKWNGASKHHELTQKQKTMSARSILAWAQVTKEQLEEARFSVPPDERPSYECLVQIGTQASILQNAHKGYLDSTIKQLYEAIKQSWGTESIKNALKVLELAGVIVTVKGGTKGAKGGRGAWRVFVSADEKELIPEDYTPPKLEPFASRSDLPTNNELSRVDNSPSRVDSEGFSGSSELPTPKESLNSSTPPLGEAERNKSLKSESEQSSSMRPAVDCAVCNSIKIADKDERVSRVINAMTYNEGTASLTMLRKRGVSWAKIILPHYPDLPLYEVARVLSYLCTKGVLPHARVLELTEKYLHGEEAA